MSKSIVYFVLFCGSLIAQFVGSVEISAQESTVEVEEKWFHVSDPNSRVSFKMPCDSREVTWKKTGNKNEGTCVVTGLFYVAIIDAVGKNGMQDYESSLANITKFSASGMGPYNEEVVELTVAGKRAIRVIDIEGEPYQSLQYVELTPSLSIVLTVTGTSKYKIPGMSDDVGGDVTKYFQSLEFQAQ